LAPLQVIGKKRRGEKSQFLYTKTNIEKRKQSISYFVSFKKNSSLAQWAYGIAASKLLQGAQL
jgi:hypothetical protein